MRRLADLPPSRRKKAADAYDMACLCVELILVGKENDVVELVQATDDGYALLGGALTLTAEVLRDLSEDDDQALRRLQAIREASRAIGDL